MSNCTPCEKTIYSHGILNISVKFTQTNCRDIIFLKNCNLSLSWMFLYCIKACVVPFHCNFLLVSLNRKNINKSAFLKVLFAQIGEIGLNFDNFSGSYEQMQMSWDLVMFRVYVTFWCLEFWGLIDDVRREEIHVQRKYVVFWKPTFSCLGYTFRFRKLRFLKIKIFRHFDSQTQERKNVRQKFLQYMLK